MTLISNVREYNRIIRCL